MNGEILEKQLPELKDDDVRTLWKICRRATDSGDPPNRSIYKSYEVILAEEGLQEKHDQIIFRWLNPLVEAFEQRNRQGNTVTLLGVCREILSANQIQIHDHDEVVDDDTHSERHVHFERRSSFDGAQHEETWLSENTQTLDIGTPGYVPERVTLRGRDVPLHGHVRANSLPNGSVSAARPTVSARLPFRQCVQDDLDTPIAELEEQAEAMLDIRDIRILRGRLTQWRTALHSLEAKKAYDEDRAAIHDATVLQKQVWEIWAIKGAFRLQRRQAEQREAFLEARLGAYIEIQRLNECRSHFHHWSDRAKQIRDLVSNRKVQILAFRYFTRWRVIAQSNAMRTRSIVLHRYFTKWHRSSLAQRTEPESADRICKRLLLRKAFGMLKQRKAQNDAHKHYLATLKRDAFAQWNDRVHRTAQQDQQAGQHAIKTMLRSVLSRLSNSSNRIQDKTKIAVLQHNRRLQKVGLDTISKQGELQPRLRTYQRDVGIYLQQKVLDTLHEATKLATQASAIRKDRLRKHSLRSLGDALRIRTMSDQIDDRLKADCLYHMLLHERQRLFQRNQNERLRHRLFSIIKQKAAFKATDLALKLELFGREAQRRALINAFRQIHVVMLKREQTEKMAKDFDQAKTTPDIGTALLASHERLQTMQKWSSDAYFFMTAKKVLRLWQDRATASRQEKRRTAYERFRNQYKNRLQVKYFAILRSRLDHQGQRTSAAIPFNSSRVSRNAAKLIGRVNGALSGRLKQQDLAAQHDRHSLLRSGLAAMSARRGHLEQNEELAKEYKDTVDQAEAQVALSRLRFATLASRARLIDSGRMLHERLSQKRCHQVLQHMATIVSQRAATRRDDTGLGQEPESPSTRPASRAASRSASKLPQSTIRTSPRTGTPAYLRTPARGRKGRFRPLPTPAPITPFTFTPGLLTSTPLRGQGLADESLLFDATSTTPQVTPFDRKLRAGGVGVSSNEPSSLRRSVLTRGIGRGAPSTSKSVRFIGGSRIGRTVIDDDTLL